MPQAIAFALAYIVSNAAAILGASVALQATLSAFAVAAAPIITAGVALGAQLLFQQTAPKVSPTDGQQALKQAMPPRTKSYGRVKLSGPIWWFQADTDGNFHFGVALNHGRISAFVTWFLDDNQATLDPVTGNVTSIPFIREPNGPLFPVYKVRILYHLGLPLEARYDDLNTIFGIDQVRGDGVATAYGRYKGAGAENFYNIYKTGAPPVIKAIIDASVVWDPRDPTQSRTDPSTWLFSDNPIVVALSYMLDPDGYAMPWARIAPALADWIAEANVCDELVDTFYLNSDTASYFAGQEARYRIAGTISLNAAPKDVMQQILTACDGAFFQRIDGAISIRAGKYRAPTRSIVDHDVLSYDFTVGNDPISSVAGIRATYMSPDHRYTEVEADPWPSDYAVSALDDSRVSTVDLTFSPSHGQARRLMKRVFYRATRRWRGTIRTNMAGLRAFDQPTINLTIAELGIDGPFEVGVPSLDLATMQVEMQVSEIGPEIDDWDAAIEFGTPPAELVLIDADSPIPDEPDLSFDSGAHTITVSGWDSRDSYQSQIDYQINGDANWSRLTVDEGVGTATIEDVTSAVTYYVRVRYEGGTGSVSQWSDTRSISTV